MIPEPIRLAKAAGVPIFGTPWDANLIVLRRPTAPIDTFDGLLTLSWTDAGGAWWTVSAPAATRPGSHFLRYPMHPVGTACLIPGRNPGSHELGMHKGTPSFVQSPGKIVRVTRDGNRNAILEVTPEDVVHEDASGINVHECGDPAYLAGCIGVPRAMLAPVRQAYRDLQARRPQRFVSLTLVEAP